MSGIEISFPGNDGSWFCLLKSVRGSRERTWEPELLQGLSSFALCTEGLASATPPHSHQDPGNWAQCFVVSYMPIFGEGNGNPLQCSCLENPTDGGAWWAAVHGVAQSWTRLRWFSSGSSSTSHFTDDKTKAQRPSLVRNNDQNQTLVIVLCTSCPLPLH